MAPRDRMQLRELLNDLFVDEPITVTLRNGVVVKGHVHSRHREALPNVTINEGDGVMSSILDDDVESVVVEDVEWRRR